MRSPNSYGNIFLVTDLPNTDTHKKKTFYVDTKMFPKIN